MLISKWSAIGDMELSIKRIGEVYHIFVRSQFSNKIMQEVNQIIFNEEKKYYFCINKNFIELHEEVL